MIRTEKGMLPFWSAEYTDAALTDATLSVNRAQRRETVLTLNRPWEGNGGTYATVIHDGEKYRMYYQTCSLTADERIPEIHVCYAESRDGLHWETPALGLCEWNGSRDNNIVLLGINDNFSIMLDSNPACPPSERYKAVMEGGFAKDFPDGKPPYKLVLLTSPDGFHFSEPRVISSGYPYDSQNTLHWDAHTGKYYCYFRDTLKNDFSPNPEWKDSPVRAVRVMESADCVHWSDATLLDYCGGEEYPTYTNCVMKYPYDDRHFIAFPTRYVERLTWNSNFEQHAAIELRKKRYDMKPRLGLATTDCVFMSSLDGYRWHRFDEATMTPGAEGGFNWIYGDCYPASGIPIKTPSSVTGEPCELSLYVRTRHPENEGVNQITRYTYRKDGFASYKSTYRPQTLTTKPMCLCADTLSLNFRTSARGFVYVTVLDEQGREIEGYRSCELFGDSLSRRVDFERPLSELRGRVIRFRFEMSDAELYALWFE